MALTNTTFQEEAFSSEAKWVSHFEFFVQELIFFKCCIDRAVDGIIVLPANKIMPMIRAYWIGRCQIHHYLEILG